LRPSWWLSSLAIALGGTAIAASAAFWKLTRMPLLAAAQPRALAMAARRGAVVQAVLAFGLLFAALVLAFTAKGLVAGFIFLAVLLIGSALALPLVLDKVLAIGQSYARSVTAQWFWADTRQQLPGLSLALMALLLAMSANVGVSTMVSSFRQTFVGFLDQRLSSELYVNAEDAAQAESIVAFVTPKVEAVLPIISTDITVRGLPTELFAMRDHATYRDNWRLLSQGDAPWDRVFEGSGILVNEQLARLGTYGDYGNPIGQAVIGEALYIALYGKQFALRYGLRLDPAAVPALVAELESNLGIPPSATINQAGIKSFSMGIFDRTFAVTGALNVLTLAVAGFAILMSLLTLATMRVPQLAPAWATGMTRRRIGQLEVIRAIVLALVTAVLALPLGLVLATRVWACLRSLLLFWLRLGQQDAWQRRRLRNC